jgi:hypothetical protein
MERWTLHIDITGSLAEAQQAAQRLLAAAVGDPQLDPYSASLSPWAEWSDDRGPVLCGREIPDAGLPWCGQPADHDGDCHP